MKPALFVSLRRLERSENIRSVWDAYDGPKEFVRKLTREGIRAVEKAEYHGFGMLVADDYVRPIKRKSSLKTLMLGHALVGGKAYGADQPYPYLTKTMASQIDYYAASSVSGVPILASSSHIPEEKCILIGCPRTDYYFGKAKGDGCTGYDAENVYLYAPTFRGVNRERYPPPRIDWELVDSMLYDDELLIVKRHTYNSKKLCGERTFKHVVEVSSKLTSREFIVDCDVLITDYSSILFDGYFCNKPSVLYCPDKDEYTGIRPMYYDYPSFYSSKYATNEHELVDMIRAARRDGMGPVELECRRVSADACDGHSSEKAAELIRAVCSCDRDKVAEMEAKYAFKRDIHTV